MNATVKTTIVILLSAGILAVSPAQNLTDPAIAAEELKQHIRTLASDELEGRRAGSKGAESAAAYIAREFSLLNLEPLGDRGSFFQEFEFVSGVELGPTNSLTLTVAGVRTTLRLSEDFLPLGFSESGSFNGGVVVVGYGISAPEKGYDDYAGINVEGKTVLLLRSHPEGGNPHSEFGRYATIRYKAVKAREQGARAVLLVTGPEDSEQDKLMKLTYDQTVGNAGILAINVTRATADRMLKEAGTTIKNLQEELNRTLKPRSFELSNVTIDFTADVRQVRRKTSNVVGLLKGTDPRLKDEAVVVGAHYDHLGYGGESSGSLKPDTVAVHNGADDNASGTAGLLELAEYFADKNNTPRRSLLFVAFSAEEIGLLGSAHLVNNPPLPIERMVAMVNMDMIGRLREGSLIVYGIGTSPGFKELVWKHNADSAFNLKLNNDGFGPSDHSSFYGKGIPVFHFFTDLHSDYHRPSDDWDKIEYEGMKTVLDYIGAVVADLATSGDRPQYVRVEAPQRPAGGRGLRSYTGTIPDFGEQTQGMKLSGVREGSPAAKAGLQAGDVIVKFGTIDIKNLYDYTFALGEYKPGDEVTVVVRRGDETKTFTIVLGQRE